MNGKRKNLRRFWAVFIALALVVQMLAPAAAYASETYTDPDGNVYTYIIDGDGKATITDFTLEDPSLPDITIPDAFNGHPVTKIGAGAFYGKSLASVEIPGSVQIIGQEAFASNPISMLVIPSGVTSIESMAFAENDIASLEIPGNVTIIGTYAFSTNILTSLTIRDGVAEIGAWAFECNLLTSVITESHPDLDWGQNVFLINSSLNVCNDEQDGHISISLPILSNWAGRAFSVGGFRPGRIPLAFTLITLDNRLNLAYQLRGHVQNTVQSCVSVHRQQPYLPAPDNQKRHRLY